ncbi:hypothetical protein SAMN05518865_12264 [Duganella sp. CF458]|nr:hypothetical protein SAMN05518865_12264 [Duganella sp. CF458]
MKALKTRIAALGKALSKSVYACRHGDLVHTVMINKDRYGGDMVSVLVSIPAFFDANAALSVETLQSPLAGDISPRGVVGTYAWEKGTIDEDLVAKTVAEFLGLFATPADVRNALAGQFVYPYYESRLPIDAPPIPAMSDLSEANYPVAGGARTLESARAAARDKLQTALGEVGFKLSPESDAIAVRPRGHMFDGVRALLDNYGSHIPLTCFPWTTAIWQVDKRWKGSYFPMLPFDVLASGKPVLFTVDEFVNLGNDKLRELVAPALELAAQIQNHHQFADALSSDWGRVAESLYRLAVKE